MYKKQFLCNWRFLKIKIVCFDVFEFIINFYIVDYGCLVKKNLKLVKNKFGEPFLTRYGIL